MAAFPPGRFGAAHVTFSMLVGLLAAASFASPAMAQRAMDESPELRRMIQQLKPSTRGIRLPAETAPVGAPVAAPVASPVATPIAATTPVAARPAMAPRPAAPAAATAAPDVPSAGQTSLLVRFASGSAELTPEAERGLTILGRALASSELAAYRFRIEGHTDTVGDAALNQALSERRAAAVRGFLTSRFGVDAARLEAVGLGESQPDVTTPDETAEPRNRRVRVVNLGA